MVAIEWWPYKSRLDAGQPCCKNEQWKFSSSTTTPLRCHCSAGRWAGSAGYELKGAASGQEALDALAVALPDALVLELDLPDIDGGEICRHLRPWTGTCQSWWSVALTPWPIAYADSTRVPTLICPSRSAPKSLSHVSALCCADGGSRARGKRLTFAEFERDASRYGMRSRTGSPSGQEQR